MTIDHGAPLSWWLKDYSPRRGLWLQRVVLLHLFSVFGFWGFLVVSEHLSSGGSRASLDTLIFVTGGLAALFSLTLFAALFLSALWLLQINRGLETGLPERALPAPLLVAGLFLPLVHCFTLPMLMTRTFFSLEMLFSRPGGGLTAVRLSRLALLVVSLLFLVGMLFFLGAFFSFPAAIAVGDALFGRSPNLFAFLFCAIYSSYMVPLIMAVKQAEAFVAVQREPILTAAKGV